MSKSDVYLITSQLKAVLQRCPVKKESTLYFNDMAVVLYARISRHSVLLHPRGPNETTTATVMGTSKKH